MANLINFLSVYHCLEIQKECILTNPSLDFSSFGLMETGLSSGALKSVYDPTLLVEKKELKLLLKIKSFVVFEKM